MSSVYELLDHGGTNAIVTRGTGKAKHGALDLVHDLSGGRKAHHGQLSLSIEIHPDPPAPNNYFVSFVDWWGMVSETTVAMSY